MIFSMNIFCEVYTDKEEDVTPPMGATQGEVSTSTDIPEQLVASHHTTVANIKDGDDYLMEIQTDCFFFFFLEQIRFFFKKKIYFFKTKTNECCNLVVVI